MHRLCTARAPRPHDARARSVGWLAFLFGVVLCLGACENVSTSDRLLSLQEIDVDPEGGLLSVHGSGFPPARACELEARGKLYVAGRAPRDFRDTLSCRSVSEQALAADMETWRAGLSGSALFEGELSVTFADDSGTLALRGRLPALRIRIQGRDADEPQQVLAEAHEARAFQRSLGIQDVEAQAAGLGVGALSPDGLAARAGLRVGDVLTRVDGAPVELTSDLRGRPNARSVELQFVRQGALQRVEIALAAEEASGIPLANQLLFALGSIVALLLPRPIHRLERARGTTRVLLMSAALLAVSVGVSRSLDARALWILPALIQLGLLAHAAHHRRLPLQRLLLEAVELGISGLAVASLGILRGSLQLPLDVEAQLAPWTYPLFVTPCGWCAALVLLRRTSALPALPAWSADLQRAAGLSTLLAFAAAPSPLPGLLMMAGLGGLLTVIELPRMPRAVFVALAAAALPLALAADAWVSTGLGALSGAALCGLTLTTALRTLVARRQAPQSTLDPRLLPFV